MDHQKTLGLRTSPFDDQHRDERHAALVVLQGEEIGRHFRLRRRAMSVGRSSEAYIRLHDDRASRLATAPRHGRTVKELVGTADAALYRAKETGRNRVCVAEE